MNNLFQKIKIKFLKNRKNIIFIIFFLLLFLSDNSFATTPEKSETRKIFEKIINIGNVFLALRGVLIGILTQFIGLFLNPAWTTGSIIGIDTHLKQLWILVSNLVYFVFAFLLIVIAFKNIMGQGRESYEMKTALPNLIVGILIVPFSWFIVQFVLSISSILTVSALSLPWDLFGKSDNTLNSISVPKKCYIDINKMIQGSQTSGGSESTTKETGKTGNKMGFDCEKETETIQSLMTKGDSLFSIMYVYTYGIMKIQDLDKLFEGQLEKKANQLGNIAANTIFNAIFVLRFLILLIALALAMFSRGVVLWLFTIFSPVFGLLYFFNGKTPKSIEGLSKLSFKNFIGLAMVPVYVGLALSFGLLFTLISVNGLSLNENKDKNNFIKDNVINIGGMELTISGRALGSYKQAQTDSSNPAKRVASGGAGFLAQLFVDIISIAVLWMSVIAALKSSEITGNVIKPIEDFGSSIGRTTMKLPQYAPIFPGGQSMQSLQQVGDLPRQALEKKFSTGPLQKIRKEFGLDDNSKAVDLLNEMQNDNDLTDKMPQIVNAFRGKTLDQISKDQVLIGILKKLGEKAKLDQEKLKLIKLGRSSDELKEVINSLNTNYFINNKWTQNRGFIGGNSGGLSVDQINDALMKLDNSNTSNQENASGTPSNIINNKINNSINVNHMEYNGRKVTGQNGEILDVEGLANLLLSRYKDDGLTKENILNMFRGRGGNNGTQEQDLIKKLEEKGFFKIENKKEEKPSKN